MSDTKLAINLANIEKINGLQNEIKLQHETIGSQRQKIIELEDKIKEVKNNSEKKIVIEETKPPVRNAWGELTPIRRIVYKANVEDAVKLMAEIVDKENESQLEKLKQDYKSLKGLYENLKDTEKERDKSRVREVEKIYEDYKEKVFQKEKSLSASNAKLKHAYEDLKEELEKVRKDKTDEILEKERKEEISKLKARIKTLEREVERLSTQGWLGKTWDRITNRKARVEALKQIEDEKGKTLDEKAKGLFYQIFPGW